MSGGSNPSLDPTAYDETTTEAWTFMFCWACFAWKQCFVHSDAQWDWVLELWIRGFRVELFFLRPEGFQKKSYKKSRGNVLQCNSQRVAAGWLAGQRSWVTGHLHCCSITTCARPFLHGPVWMDLDCLWAHWCGFAGAKALVAAGRQCHQTKSGNRYNWDCADWLVDQPCKKVR